MTKLILNRLPSALPHIMKDEIFATRRRHRPCRHRLSGNHELAVVGVVNIAQVFPNTHTHHDLHTAF